MDRKERVLMAIDHRQTDRLPMHINATKWVVEKLKNRLGISTDRELMEKLCVDIYDMRGIDLHTGIAPHYVGPENPLFSSLWAGNVMSFWGIEEIQKHTDSGYLWELPPAPLASASTIEELENYNWPSVEWFDFSEISERLSEWEDFCIMASGCSVFQHATFIRGMDNLMMDMCLQPEMAHFVLNKVADFYFEYYSRMFEVAGNKISVFALADDLGMQNSLLLSPELMEEYVFPNLKRMCDLAHKHGMKLLLHTCGNIESIIPRLVELGVDVLDPIQPECMDPLYIKEKYGKDICLRGGISVQNIVSRGTVDEVESEARRIAETLKIGGGYIFSPGHPVLQDDIPVENIIALYEAGRKYGGF